MRNGLLLAALGLVGGLQYTLLKVAVDARLGEPAILLISTLFVAALCVAIMAWRRAWFRVRAAHLRFFIGSGLIGFVLPLAAVAYAAQSLSAGLIVVFEALTPAFTVVIAMACRTEPVSRAHLYAILLGALAVLLVGAHRLTDGGSGEPLAMLVVLLAPLAYAIEAVYVARYWPQDLDVAQVAGGESVLAVALLLPLYLLSDSTFAVPLAWTAGHSALLLFASTCVVETLLFYRLIRDAGAVFISLANVLSLFGGILCGVMLLGETHAPLVWFAALLLCASMCLLRLDGDAQSQPSAWRLDVAGERTARADHLV